MQAERSILSQVIRCHERIVRLLRRIAGDLETGEPNNMSDDAIIASCSRSSLQQCTFPCVCKGYLLDNISGGFVFTHKQK